MAVNVSQPGIVRTFVLFQRSAKTQLNISNSVVNNLKLTRYLLCLILVLRYNKQVLLQCSRKSSKKEITGTPLSDSPKGLNYFLHWPSNFRYILRFLKLLFPSNRSHFPLLLNKMLCLKIHLLLLTCRFIFDLQ